MRINLALKIQGVHMFDDPVFFQLFLSANKQVLYGYKIRCPKITVFKKKLVLLKLPAISSLKGLTLVLLGPPSISIFKGLSLFLLKLPAISSLKGLTLVLLGPPSIYSFKGLTLVLLGPRRDLSTLRINSRQ